MTLNPNVCQLILIKEGNVPPEGGGLSPPSPPPTSLFKSCSRTVFLTRLNCSCSADPRSRLSCVKLRPSGATLRVRTPPSTLDYCSTTPPPPHTPPSRNAELHQVEVRLENLTVPVGEERFKGSWYFLTFRFERFRTFAKKTKRCVKALKSNLPSWTSGKLE